MINPLTEETKKHCEEYLEKENATIKEIDDVVLVEDLGYLIVIKCFVKFFLKKSHIKGRHSKEVIVLQSEITCGNLATMRYVFNFTN